MVIALAHAGEPLHLINNFIHQFLQPFGEVAVGFLALDCSELRRQLQHEPLGIRVVAHTIPHGLHQFQHRPAGFPYQFISGIRLLFVEMEHFIAENIVGELGLDLTDTFLGEIGLARLCGPGHHVDVRVLALIVKGGVPAEVTWWYLHCRRDVVAVRSNEISPRRSVIEAELGRILTLEGDDVRPHISRVVLQFFHGLAQRDRFLITEQTVGTNAFSTRTGGDVLHVLVRLMDGIPVGLESQRDERRGVDLGGFRQVVLVLVERLAVREVFDQLGDELLLLSGGRTVIRDELHPLPGRDVAQVSGGPAGAFDIGTLEDQSCHSSSSQSGSWRERAYFSREMIPFVAFTFRTLCARLRFKSSRSISNASATIPLVMSCSTHLVKSLRAI